MKIDKKMLKADISGGIAAAIIALPLAMGFGVAIFSPLGPEYTATGALAGMYGAIFTGIFAALFGGTPSQITGPTGPMTVVLTSTVATLMKYQLEQGQATDVSMILTLTFLVVFLGGLVQIALGLLKGGSVIKYIPYPVIAGFMNGIAVIIFIGQIEKFFGITEGKLFDNFSLNWLQSSANLKITAISAITIAIILISNKLTKKVPAALVGLILGTLSYLLIGKLFDSNLLIFENNPFIIGAIPQAIPSPKNFTAFLNIYNIIDLDLLKLLIPAAISLGILGSIDSLLTSLVADVETKTRHNSNKELVGQGIGNIVSGLFAGVSGAGATVRTLVNVKSGGRTKVSGVVHGLFLLTVLLFLGEYAGWIPMSVLAGILIVTSFNMINTWSLSLIKRKTAIKDFFVVILVTIITVAIDLMVAVGIGFAVTIIILLKDLIQKSVIHKKYRCNNFRSRVAHSEKDEGVLAEFGGRILVYELEGNLFFGTTDKLLTDVEKEIKETDIIIFDLKHIRHIDITGAKLIKQIANSSATHGCQLFLSSFCTTNKQNKNEMIKYLHDLEVTQTIGEDKIFNTLDEALETAENQIINERSEKSTEDTSKDNIKDSSLFCELTNEEFTKISAFLQKEEYKSQAEVFKKGDKGERIYIVKEGKVSMFINLDDNNSIRLATFGKGLFFGEMSVLNASKRSSNAICTENSTIFSLEKTKLDNILKQEPIIGKKILFGITSELADRLRTTTKALIKLETT